MRLLLTGLILASTIGVTFIQPAPVWAQGTTAEGAARAGEEGKPGLKTETEHAKPATDYWTMMFVFVLSAFIGMGVIGRVSRLLHTPLMSLTNAISAIAVVGSIVVAGSEDYPTPIRVMGAIALFASMTNIVSGFMITHRMLKMFKQTR